MARIIFHLTDIDGGFIGSKEGLWLDEFREGTNIRAKYKYLYSQYGYRFKGISIEIDDGFNKDACDIDLLMEVIGIEDLRVYLNVIEYLPDHVDEEYYHYPAVDWIIKLLRAIKPTLYKMELSYNIGGKNIRRICNVANVDVLTIYYSYTLEFVEIPSHIECIYLERDENMHRRGDVFVGTFGGRYHMKDCNIYRMSSSPCWKFIESFEIYACVCDDDFKKLDSVSIYKLKKDNSSLSYFANKIRSLRWVMSPTSSNDIRYKCVKTIIEEYEENIYVYDLQNGLRMRNMIKNIQPELADIIDDYYQIELEL
jgi:hypothetical protein